MRCVFRETPPPLIEARLVDPDELKEAIRESFYGGLGLELALYPSLEDALVLLAERLGGLYPASPLPTHISRLIKRSGRVPLYANPDPRGGRPSCREVCRHEVVVVYEGARVYNPADSLVLCDCKVYSVATLKEYGVDSSIAWVAGLEGGIRASRIPGYTRLRGLAGAVRRLRSRAIAALTGHSKPLLIGPFAAFYREKPNVIGEIVDAARYGVRGWAVSLFMEPGCYLRV